jgi:hypothetical protein
LRKQTNDKDGYCNIILSNSNKERKIFKVHRIVGMTFIPNSKNLPMINHKDGNKENNNVENLEWCDDSYNNKHRHILNPMLFKGESHPNNKLNNEQVLNVYNAAWEGKLKYKEIAEQFNVLIGDIYNIKYGKQWVHITNHKNETCSHRPEGEANKSSKLTEAQVLEIYNLAWNSNMSNAEIGRKFYVNKENIRAIKNGKTWKHVTSSIIGL